MGIFDKIFRKKEDFDFDKMTGEGMPPADDFMAQPGMETPTAEAWAPTSPAQRSGFAPQTITSGHNPDWELINSKLDTIKAQLGAIEQRLANIERGTTEQQKRLW